MISSVSCSAFTSPEIQEFSGILGIFKDRKGTFQELVASYTIDIEDWNIL